MGPASRDSSTRSAGNRRHPPSTRSSRPHRLRDWRRAALSASLRNPVRQTPLRTCPLRAIECRARRRRRIGCVGPQDRSSADEISAKVVLPLSVASRNSSAMPNHSSWASTSGGRIGATGIRNRMQRERIVSAQAVQRRHDRARDRRAANTGTEPEPPDRRGQKRLLPPLAHLVTAGRERRLQPRFPCFEEDARRRQRDEVALGTQLSKQAAAHDRAQIPLGQRKSLSVERLSGLRIDPVEI